MIDHYIRGRVNLLKDIIRNPFAWPGGYEKALLMNDGGVVCHVCAKNEYWNILHSTRGEYNDGWDVRAVFLIELQSQSGDQGYDAQCDHCSREL